ncbi:type II secretion system F family protein [Photobacterium sp. WH77]|uniref:type II secretion system F family protein n=1 Tax=unclassified Photobacterium TaxID=2628852 RepID=UPI001EDB3922|nr:MULTISPECIES: type II secretion system F family protein [unclassified Photobacterium]MCG2837853.1 type II secretion system F family protein [Photobacterium sp. WH77]MCG2845471.1 type II secretion system F family protein [Photobacterium sp. WH80]
MNSAIFIAVVLLLASCVLMVIATRRPKAATSKAAKEKAATEKARKQGADERPVQRKDRLQENWQRLGLSTSVYMLVVYAACLLCGPFVLARLSGIGGLGIGLLVSVGFILLLGQIRKSNKRRKILQQLPGFIDHLNRRIHVGMSLNKAVEQVLPAMNNPLRSAAQRAVQRTSLGTELYDSFYKEAKITGVQEFALLGSVFKVNHQFGGSVTAALENLVELLHQQERSQRELKSMTGETRVTAWVMGVAPTAMAIYMLVSNPQQLLSMWADESGRQALMLGIGAQVLGALVLWRMVRSL